MQQPQHYKARIIASVAATVIALACGTNYVYSAWAPQFAERLKLSATQSNLIGLFGNLGMYSLGVPFGILIDNYGPRPFVLVGAALLAIGYFPLHQAYDRGSGSVALLCFFSLLSGLGGCMAFSSAVKTSVLNWPQHRGTATAFPLAAFGLSAFFFAFLGSVFFPGDPSEFLMLLSCGTSGATFVGFFFLKVHGPSTTSATYQAVPVGEDDAALPDSQPLHRTSSEEFKPRRSGAGARAAAEPGTSSDTSIFRDSPVVHSSTSETNRGPLTTADIDHSAVDETSSLLSSIVVSQGVVGTSVDLGRSQHLDIRGFKLLRNVGFWQLFSIMAILSGVGIMTINNIGNDAKALWQHYDDSVSEDFLVSRQQMHVSILSVGSFLGRLSSGMGSDFLVKKLHASRVWCLVVASIIFFVAQLGALNIENPHLLGFVSGFSGLGYGLLFGVYPSITAETFGTRGLSQNWGFMTLAPVFTSNIFNLFYGAMYDRRSIVKPGGHRVCMEGIDCYKPAYWMTLVSCVIGLCVTLLTIRHQHRQHLRESIKADVED